MLRVIFMGPAIARLCSLETKPCVNRYLEKPKQINVIYRKEHDNNRLCLSFQAEIFTAYKPTCLSIIVWQELLFYCYFLCLLLNFSNKSLIVRPLHYDH